MKVLINVSNHPSSSWSEEQKADWSEIIDIPHPPVDPSWCHLDVVSFAVIPVIQQLDTIAAKYNHKLYLSVQGDYSFCYLLYQYYNKDKFYFVVPTTERKTLVEVVDGVAKKTSYFKFVRWRHIPYVNNSREDNYESNSN